MFSQFTEKAADLIFLTNSICDLNKNAVQGIKNHKGAILKTAFALVIIAALGAALLGYMHLSGLGISKAGFVGLGHRFIALGHRIKDLMNIQHSLTPAELLYKVALPTAGSVILLALGVMKGPAAVRFCASKIKDRLQQSDQLERRRRVATTSSRLQPEEGWDFETSTTRTRDLGRDFVDTPAMPETMTFGGRLFHYDPEWDEYFYKFTDPTTGITEEIYCKYFGDQLFLCNPSEGNYILVDPETLEPKNFGSSS